MEFSEVVERRRMSRAFSDREIQPSTIETLLQQARRAPSAGNTAALEFLVLSGREEVALYWDTTLPADRRPAFPWPRLLDAPLLIIPWVDPGAYVKRYSQTDKAHTGLGSSESDWTVPYWFVDGGAAVMTLLHGAVDADLGALFFGLFGDEDAVRTKFGVPVGRRAVGCVAIGHPLPERKSSSVSRPRPTLDQIVHRGRW